MIYVCECGKSFENPQAFNGHKSHCPRHYMSKYGNLDYYNEIKKSQIENLSISNFNRAVRENKEKLNKWISEQHKCEKCGKVMTEKFGSGRFCSRSCANSRTWTPEINEKRRVSALLNPSIIEQMSEDKRRYYEINGISKTCKHIYISSECDTKLNKKPKITNTYLLTLYEDYINSHNKNILDTYEQFLASKAIGKSDVFEDYVYYAKYYAIWNPNHLRQHENYVFVHILLAEKLLDRPLTKSEIVHHKNLDKLDNRFDNIYIFDSKSSHTRFHYAKYCWLRIENDVLVCDKIDMPKLREHHKKVTNNT